MRESRLYGSARGAPSNGRPYRDRREFITLVAGAAAGLYLSIGLILGLLVHTHYPRGAQVARMDSCGPLLVTHFFS